VLGLLEEARGHARPPAGAVDEAGALHELRQAEDREFAGAVLLTLSRRHRGLDSQTAQETEGRGTLSALWEAAEAPVFKELLSEVSCERQGAAADSSGVWSVSQRQPRQAAVEIG